MRSRLRSEQGPPGERGARHVELVRLRRYERDVDFYATRVGSAAETQDAVRARVAKTVSFRAAKTARNPLAKATTFAHAKRILRRLRAQNDTLQRILRRLRGCEWQAAL